MSFIVGEIRAFAFADSGAIGGGNAFTQLKAQGWRECNGESLLVNQFTQLFQAIGFNWGSEDRPNTFKLPDLRGYFLRGWDHGLDRDPDAGSRLGIHVADAANDFVGATGDMVGSVQADQFKMHQHQFVGVVDYRTAGGKSNRAAPSGGKLTDPTGGAETRPMNAYVMYCIFTGRAG